ncbi:MAG: hypothetical protein R3B91_13985 [Planctomycetaceae bacterium]
MTSGSAGRYFAVRLIPVARAVKVRPKRRAEFEFQGFVDGKMVYSGSMIGVPISRDHVIH